jgi:hypothetical protein
MDRFTNMSLYLHLYLYTDLDMTDYLISNFGQNSSAIAVAISNKYLKVLGKCYSF